MCVYKGPKTLLRYLILLVVLCKACSKSVQREKDFYTIEISFELNHIRKACQAVQRSEKKMAELGLTRIEERKTYGKITENLVSECIKGLTELYEQDQMSHSDMLQESPSKNFYDIAIRLKKWDWLGEAWHWASGAPGPTEYAAEEKNFKKIKHALQEQYSVNEQEDAAMNLLRENGNEMIKDVTHLANELFRTNTELRNATDYIEKGLKSISFYSLCANTLHLANLKISHLKQAVDLARIGYMSKTLVPVKKLKKILAKVEKENSNIKPIYSQNEATNYYDLKNTKRVTSHEKLNFYVRIPLIDPQYSATLEPIPLHVKQLNGIKSDFYLIEQDNMTYSTVTLQEVSNFFPLGPRGYLSSERPVNIRLGAATDINAHLKEIWIERITQNEFIMRTKEEKAMLKCGSDKTVINLPTLSYFTLPESCELIGNSFEIATNMMKGLEKTTEDEEFGLSDLEEEMTEINKQTLQQLAKVSKTSLNSVILNRTMHQNMSKKLLQLEIDQTNNYWRDIIIASVVSSIAVYVFTIGIIMQARRKCRKNNRIELNTFRMSDLRAKDEDRYDDRSTKSDTKLLDELKSRIEAIEDRLGNVGITMD